MRGVQDFDGGQIGQVVTQSFLNATGPKDAITWRIKPASDFPSGTSELANMVHDEKAWAIVASAYSPFAEIGETYILTARYS